MLPETTRTRIEQDATAHMHTYVKGMIGDDEFMPSNLKWSYIAGATAEAEMSAAWKAEATLLINKIHDWAEGDKTLPLGHSVFDEAVKRLKAYDELREKAQRLADALESVKKDLEVIIEVYPTLAAAKVGINTIDNALQQWRGEK